MQLSDFKAVSTEEETAAAHCAEEFFNSMRNALPAGFSICLHGLLLRTSLENESRVCGVNTVTSNRHTVSFSLHALAQAC